MVIIVLVYVSICASKVNIRVTQVENHAIQDATVSATTLLFPLLIQLVGIFYPYLSPYLSPIDLIAASRPRSTVTGP